MFSLFVIAFSININITFKNIKQNTKKIPDRTILSGIEPLRANSLNLLYKKLIISLNTKLFQISIFVHIKNQVIQSKKMTKKETN